jgi:hypothetical protein
VVIFSGYISLSQALELSKNIRKPMILAKKIYNSVTMALLTQSTAALILAAPRLVVKRSVPPGTPWNMASP